jgi:hypothetical protein
MNETKLQQEQIEVFKKYNLPTDKKALEMSPARIELWILWKQNRSSEEVLKIMGSRKYHDAMANR